MTTRPLLERCYTKSEVKKMLKLLKKNYIEYYISDKYGKKFFKNLKGIEIESKLTFDGKYYSGLTNKIYSLFKNPGIENFRIPRHYPFIIKKAKANFYFEKGKKKVKVLASYDRISSNFKQSSKVLPNKYGLKCIIERKEKKSHDQKSAMRIFNSWDLIGSFFRERKTFWIDKEGTGRTYHVTIDLCKHKNKRLHELEVEYCGNYRPVKMSKEEKQGIIDDISFLTYFIRKKFPFLKQTSITKYSWLKSTLNKKG